eukprot:SAG31_NODE_974_length_10627_cov_11.246201_9_plen_54_part_00
MFLLFKNHTHTRGKNRVGAMLEMLGISCRYFGGVARAGTKGGLRRPNATPEPN